MVSAAMLCGGAAMAETQPSNVQPSNTQLHRQISALQKEVAQLQAHSNVQSDSIAGYQLPSGG
jgi:hypothetical protein